MGLRVGVLGVGPVGEHLVQILNERKFPVDGSITIMATRERNEIIDGIPVNVQKASEEFFKKLDLVFFAGKEGSKGASLEWADIAVKNGCVVIDNGGDLRMYSKIPLVIPEINMDDVTKETRLICNPNCSTIQMALALYPLHRISRLKRVIVSTYQSVSGHSGAAMDLLKTEIKQTLIGESFQEDPAVFTRSAAFNCIPHIDRFEKNGYTREEMKMVNETRKIFNEPSLLISATTVRVPVLVGHSESINAEFIEPMHAQKAIEILSDPAFSPGVVYIDGITDNKDSIEIRHDPLERRYPVALDLEKAEWKDSVLVGRIRDDIGTTDYNGRSIELLEQSFLVRVTFFAFLIKLIFTAVTMGSGFVGGEAIPLFIIGATLGNTLSIFVGLPMSFLAALGLVAVFCGGSNTPIAAFVLGVEMFKGQAVEYFFLVCIISYIVSGHHGLWPSQMIFQPKSILYKLVAGDTIEKTELKKNK